jgi:hypothetical protein
MKKFTGAVYFVTWRLIVACSFGFSYGYGDKGNKAQEDPCLPPPEHEAFIRKIEEQNKKSVANTKVVSAGQAEYNEFILKLKTKKIKEAEQEYRERLKQIELLSAKSEARFNEDFYKETASGTGFYVAPGIDVGFIFAKDKVTSQPRTLTYNTMKMQYSSELKSLLWTYKLDENKNVIYEPNGYPKIERRLDPNEYLAKIGLFTKDNDENYNLAANVSDHAVRDALAPYVNDSLTQWGFYKPGDDNLFSTAAEKIQYNGTYDDKSGFHFADNNGDRIDPQMLSWDNLRFGEDIPLKQVLSDYIWNANDGLVFNLNQADSGVKNTLYSRLLSTTDEKGRFNTKFQEIINLPASDDLVKASSKTIGASLTGGYGFRIGNVSLGIELGLGYSNAKTKIYSNENKGNDEKMDAFADGKIQYIKTTDIVTDPNDKSIVLGQVFNPATQAVKSTFLSGFGRLVSPKSLSVTPILNPYELDIKKSFGISIAGTIGYAFKNTIFYCGMGVNAGNYKVTIVPNQQLRQFSGYCPAGAMKGTISDFNNGDFTYAFSRPDETNSGKFSLLYPGAFIRKNAAGEPMTMSGLIVTYPHYEDSGISIEGKTTSRPYINDNNLNKALETRTFKRTGVGWEPMIGGKLFFLNNWFVDARISYIIGSAIKIDYSDFAAAPIPFGREGLQHKIKVTECKVCLKLGKSLGES